MDEAHVLFDAHAWAESGLSLTYYNSQHRKLNDEVIFVTQFLELIDKRCRGFAQSYHYFRNSTVEKFLTVFRAPGHFLVKVYQRPPTGMLDQPSEVHRYGLNKELADCYDTSAGVGISGRKKPEKKNTKGFAFWWVLVPVGIGCGLLWWAPDFAARKIAGTQTGGRLGHTVGLLPGAAPVADANPASPAAPEASPAHLSQLIPQRETERVWLAGAVVSGGKYLLVLSDGRRYSSDDGLAKKANLAWVEIEGQRYYWRPAVSRPQIDTGTQEKGPSEALSRPGGAAGPSSAASGSLPREEGSWVTGLDGVSRLRDPIRPSHY